MKLGTIKNGHRDGQLVVVSRDLQRFVPASNISPTLQHALDSWDHVVADLEALSESLNSDSQLGTPVDFSQFLSPLPRAYEWVDGSAFINHVVLVRKARGAEPPPTLYTDPLVYQGGSGIFLSPLDSIELEDESWGLDFESEVCVILGDTPQGVKAENAESVVRLITIANDVSLRGLIPNELQKGFGFFQSKPATAFAPVACTPDELGDAWSGGRLHLPMISTYNEEKFGDPDAGNEMHFSFHQLIEHISKTRSFTAGTILGSGTVSNEDRSRGSSCLAEVRMIETIDEGKPKTPFMKPGDRIEIEMLDKSGHSIFGKIINPVVSK